MRTFMAFLAGEDIDQYRLLCIKKGTDAKDVFMVQEEDEPNLVIGVSTEPKKKGEKVTVVVFGKDVPMNAKDVEWFKRKTKKDEIHWY